MQTSTCGVRSASRSGGGTRSGILAWRILCLARVIRWPTAASLCSSARAISGTVRPDTSRKRQCQLGQPLQCRMRTGEHHPQLVVADRVRGRRDRSCLARRSAPPPIPFRTDGFAAQPISGAVAGDVISHPPGCRATVAGPGAKRCRRRPPGRRPQRREVAGPPRERGNGGSPFAGRKTPSRLVILEHSRVAASQLPRSTAVRGGSVTTAHLGRLVCDASAAEPSSVAAGDSDTCRQMRTSPPRASGPRVRRGS